MPLLNRIGEVSVKNQSFVVVVFPFHQISHIGIIVNKIHQKHLSMISTFSKTFF